MEAVLENDVKSPSAKDAIKAEVSLSNLQKALRIIERGIVRASTIPILQSVRIEQLAEGLAIQSTDLDSSIKALIPEITKLSVPLLIPSDRFLPWAKLLEGEQVKITASSARVTLQSAGHLKGAKALFPRLDVKNFPAFQFTGDGEGFEMQQDDLLRILKHTIIAIGDEVQYTLNGILLEADGSTLYAVATDGHRMAIYSRPMPKAFRYLIPERMLKLLLPVIVEGRESVRIQEQQGGFLASVAADIPVFVSCRKPNGTFPNWRAAMPNDFQATVAVDSQALLGSLGRCILIGDKKSHAVKMEFTSNGVNLWAVDALAGEAEESVDATGGPNEPYRLGVNGTYLAQALKQITGDVLVKLPKEYGQSVLFYSQPAEGEAFNYIVMPLRIS